MADSLSAVFLSMFLEVSRRLGLLVKRVVGISFPFLCSDQVGSFQSAK